MFVIIGVYNGVRQDDDRMAEFSSLVGREYECSIALIEDGLRF